MVDGLQLHDPASDTPLAGSDAALRETRRGPGGDIRASFYVITVNYGHDAQLVRLLESLRTLGYLTRVIIVDHSDPSPLDGDNYPFPIERVRAENRGYGAGLNRGLNMVGDPNGVALLCNPDVRVLDPDGLGEAIRYLLSEPRIGCLLPRLINAERKPIYSVRKFYDLWSLAASRIPLLRNNPRRFMRDHFCVDAIDRSEPVAADWGSGSALLVRTSMFPHALSFDERFFLYFEDVDLCAAVWKRGLSVVFYPRAVVMHEEQGMSRKSIRFLLMHFAGLIRFVIKYRGLPNRGRLTDSYTAPTGAHRQ
ncbi:MAG: glycosyltransferase [Pseudomonadota bacterium]